MSDGFLVVDKAPGMTSHDVVAIGRRALNTRKVGHAGTLDPMATGVLVLGFNNGTRLLQYITDGDKSYTATIVLGASTTTDDHEGEVTSTTDASQVDDAESKESLPLWSVKLCNARPMFQQLKLMERKLTTVHDQEKSLSFLPAKSQSLN
jgi:tRNA pseudouridine(55) synthase